MSAAYIFTKDEFVYLINASGGKLIREQFEEATPFCAYINSGDKLAVSLYESDIIDGLVRKHILKCVQGKYVIDGVLYMIFTQMAESRLLCSSDMTISKYECSDMDVYVCNDRFSKRKCCLYPCRKDHFGDVEDIVELEEFNDEFHEYIETLKEGECNGQDPD